VRILFLDDMEQRHRDAPERFGFDGADVVSVWSHNEAVAALGANEPFDVAYLDHDLPSLTGAVEKTGYHVALHIAQMAPDRRPRRIVVHSSNPLGRRLMAELLADAGCDVVIEPFDVFES
jgi:CheY-like chemotaxis protein